MQTTKTGFRLSESTLEQLDALAHRDSAVSPNRTATLARIVEIAYEAAGRPAPAPPRRPRATPRPTTVRRPGRLKGRS